MPGLWARPILFPLFLYSSFSPAKAQAPCADPLPSFLPQNGGTTDGHPEAGGWASLGDRWQTFVVRAHIAAIRQNRAWSSRKVAEVTPRLSGHLPRLEVLLFGIVAPPTTRDDCNRASSLAIAESRTIEFKLMYEHSITSV
ncbi:hypothetical protein P5V15_010520 [Pogonomyrmex californicus]